MRIFLEYDDAMSWLLERGTESAPVG